MSKPLPTVKPATVKSAALKPADLHLLVALAEEPLHGYALAQRMEEESGGQVRLLPGNLYAILRRLEQAGLVAPAPTTDGTDRRRRCFALTARGRRVLLGQARTLAHTVDLIHSRLAEDDGATS